MNEELIHNYGGALMDRQINSPDIIEKYCYLSRNKWAFASLGTLSATLLVVGSLSYALTDYWLFIWLPFIAFMAAYLTVSYGIGLFSKEFDFTKHRAIAGRHARSAKEKSVDIYLPICNEDIDIIRNAWEHIKQIKWKNLKVYVLDDGKSDIARDMATEFGFDYIRRTTNYMKKSGNLHNAFQNTSGEFILIVDADFCVRPDILHELVPHMIENPKLCIVQSPQYFEVSSWMNWIERGAAQIQEFFYRYTQVSRNKWKASICVGTSALYRRSALAEMGGFRLKEWSEDVWNGFSMVDRGWEIEYVSLNLSKGRCPNILRQLFNQQYRWACGSLSLGKNPEFWKSKLTLIQKLCYVSGMMYFIFSAFIPFLILVPGPLAVWLFPEQVFYMNLGYYLPSLIFGTIVYREWSHYKGWDLNFFVIRLFSYFTNFFALKDTILNTTAGWVATGSTSSTGKPSSNFRWYQIMAITMVLGNIIAIVGGYMYNMDVIGIYNILPSFVSSAFYGVVFSLPVIRNWLSNRN